MGPIRPAPQLADARLVDLREDDEGRLASHLDEQVLALSLDDPGAHRSLGRSA
jgi:hypothetical protein